MIRRGRFKRRLFQKKGTGKSGDEVALQITSMADIFTILLVFLLKGIASDAIQIAPSNGTKLPSGMNTRPMTEVVLQVELNKDGILVEKEFVTSLENYRVPASVQVKNGIIPALNEKLAKERERQKLIAASNDSVKSDGRAIILSDENVPFHTLKPILNTLSANGYSDIKFAVVKAE